jgi:hypothetical protein
MKRIIIAFLILGFSECFSQEASNLPLTIKVIVDREYILTRHKSYYQKDIQRQGLVVNSDSVKQKFYDVSIDIKSTSNKPISIWLMKCSWEDNFIINNNYIFIQRLPCDSNYPIRITLRPGESKIYRGTLLKSIKFDYPGQQLFGQQVETTKFGLIVIGDIFADEKIDYFLEMEDKSKWKMVWSNALFLYGKQSENQLEK